MDMMKPGLMEEHTNLFLVAYCMNSFIKCPHNGISALSSPIQDSKSQYKNELIVQFNYGKHFTKII